MEQTRLKISDFNRVFLRANHAGGAVLSILFPTLVSELMSPRTKDLYLSEGIRYKTLECMK